MKKLLLIVFFITSANVSANEWSGYIGLESRLFAKDALHAEQFNDYASISIQPEWYHKWDGGNQSLSFIGFSRWDQHDEKRTHSDIRELSWLTVFKESELRVGIRKVFWGVTESQHLVDVINQTDLVEGMDGEDKLGQPMINYALIQDWGTVDFYILPYFRERTFPGINGRLRSEPRVDTSNPIYESKDKENHLDTALRWSHSMGDWDIGLSHFNGTSRDPTFTGGLDSDGEQVLRPIYNLMQQTSIDLQATKEAWLWKLEAINRTSSGSSYIAATAGFEYTFTGVFDSASDLGIVAEYMYDDRRNLMITPPFENDALVALRWTRNDEQDTNVLMGLISDLDDSSRIFSVEANRRIGDNWKLTLEARLFRGFNDSTNPLYALRKDDFIQVEMAYYF